MTQVVSKYLSEYNSASKKPLNLVLFQFALEHIARLARVMRQPGGHALLVGVGGSGRQSLTQLAAFIQDLTVFSVEISSSYTVSGLNNNWHDDLKKALRYAGEKRKPSVFLFSDSQILQESMVRGRGGDAGSYSSVIAELLPTPAKTHYLFNLRDLSKVFQGMSSAGADVMTDTAKMIRLWVHEVLRVFHDRLIDDADRTWIASLISSKIELHFQCKPSKVLERLLLGQEDESGAPAKVGAAELRTLMWGDFMVPGAEPPRYDEITDAALMTQVVSNYLSEYNSASKKPLNLVLFQFALEHIARLARVMRQPGGHALLVGVGGSGRQSLTQLAAFIQDLTVFSVEISSTYTVSGLNNNWHDDLKKALRYAGEKRKPSVFLFSDSQILQESMVEDINNLLNTGEVPNLFDVGEALAIGEAVRSKAKAVRMDSSRADLFAYFVQEVRRNLHVVLCFSPVGDAFRERLRKFPSLVTCTTIDWFTVWPDDALRSVAHQALGP
ncbi:uncharacterized protein HaLaN_07015, partial [Haematococcus lacustris]